MRFLLVAPAVERRDAASRGVEIASHASPAAPSDSQDAGTAIERVDIVRVDEYDIVTAIVRTGGGESSVDELEGRLHALAEHAVSSLRSVGELRWVSRIQLVDGSAEAEVWPSSHHEIVEIADGARLAIGWGSGRIEGWDSTGSAVQRDILVGLAQAQALWCELADLVESSRADVERVYVSGSARDADRTLTRLAGVNATLQLHTLAWSELLRGVRATPRAVARAALDAWDYPSLRAQVDDDIAAAMSHAQVLERLAGARYQRAVELVLLALTVVSALGLVIGIVDLSYTVGTDSSASILGAIRSADANVILVVSGLVLLGVLVLLQSSRRTRAGGGR